MKLRDNLSLIVPIGSSLIIFASAIKNVLFYSVYNIAIIRYVTLSDFLLLIIIDAVFLITSFVLMGIFYLAFEDKNISKKPNYDSQKIPTIPIIIWSLILFFGLTSIIFFGKTFSYGFIAICLTVLFFTNLFFFLYLKDKIAKQNKEIFSILGTLLSIVLIMSALAFRDVFQLSNKASSHTYTIILESETITTDNNLLYIGKTSEYLFLYDKKQDMSRILKTALLKEMNVQSIKKD